MSLRSIFQQLGLADGSLYAAGQVLRTLTAGHCRIVKYVLTAQPIGSEGGGGAKPMRPDAATTLQQVGRGDALVATFPRPADVIARRYAAGAICTAATVRGRFAGFVWLQRGRYEEDEVRCSYVLDAPAVSVWDYDVYVEPDFRVGRTMARLWSRVDAELAATGVRWSFSRISAFNAGSLASHARLGAVRCGSAVFVVLGPLQLAVLPGWPFVHVSTSAKRAPVLRLRPPGHAAD